MKRELLLEREARSAPNCSQYIWEKRRGLWFCVWIKDESTNCQWVDFEKSGGVRLEELCTALELDPEHSPQSAWPTSTFEKITEADLFAIFL